jgi:hypothetical protein
MMRAELSIPHSAFKRNLCNLRMSHSRLFIPHSLVPAFNAERGTLNVSYRVNTILPTTSPWVSRETATGASARG